MTNADNMIERLRQAGIPAEAAGFGRPFGNGARRPRCPHSGSGGAAPVQSGEAGSMGDRRNAPRVRRQTASNGAAQQAYSPVPIWLAALSATRCLATSNGQDHAVSWDCVSGRAVYTNAGAHTETIQPLGVSLRGGQTLAVYWMPGETGYTLEIQ